MKKLFFLMTYLFCFNLFGQHTIELCPNQSRAIRYFSETNGVGSIRWFVNNVLYDTDVLLYNFTSTGTYNIVLQQQNGPCLSERTMVTTVVPCSEVIYWIPNTFTPDNDEHNQTFKPIITDGIDIFDFSLRIYNRWGQIIWESRDVNGEWDGSYKNKKCPDGVYTWVLSFGLKNNDKRITDYGHMQIIR
jgi:gliding motility-associated-like protein